MYYKQVRLTTRLIIISFLIIHNLNHSYRVGKFYNIIFKRVNWRLILFIVHFIKAKISCKIKNQNIFYI